MDQHCPRSSSKAVDTHREGTARGVATAADTGRVVVATGGRLHVDYFT